MSAPPPRPDLEPARRAVLVRRPLHWEVAAALVAALEEAWRELDARAGIIPEARAGDPAQPTTCRQ
ncbi:MAG: hypothetical protein IT385_12460 [Deltaproteobacteria bacterium]|nr:hypothetical protein [Deltaproteobacteria bacterium]